MCVWIYLLVFALYSQCWHWNLWPSWSVFMCVWRFPFCVALCSHCGHGNLLPSWMDFMCFWRSFFRVDLCSQCGHGNFWPSWIDFMCFCRIPFWVAWNCDDMIFVMLWSAPAPAVKKPSLIKRGKDTPMIVSRTATGHVCSVFSWERHGPPWSFKQDTGLKSC